MPLVPGTRLGPYEVISVVGAGGMGEVYRARDTRLERDVALKILSPQLARDPDALARFEREALSVARLSHPNILAIHELGRQDQTTYVVTELVDGETLRARLANGPLTPRRAVAYAQQIARGIAAAHARGIVHRDLKPENVMITRDDHVKILDFGLAKPIAPAQTDETRATDVRTSAGTVIGTFAYMAPEQVRGLELDHRADIFSFGAVLYEMLSGERAFKGETAADTMTAVLSKDPPDLDVTRMAISPALERIVRRCLEKAPELRFQSANDLAFALETLSATSSSSASGVGAVAPPPPVPASRVAWLPWTVAGLAVLVAAGVWILRPAPSPPQLWRRFTPLTEAAGEETAPSISPDGGSVVYVMRQNGRAGIYAQRVGGRNATPIVVDPARDLGAPAYSPDGSQIAFHESDDNGGIFIAGATGESVRRLTDIGFDPAWSPDGKRIAYSTEEIHEPGSRQAESATYVVDLSSGASKRVIDGDAVQAAWSPNGRRLVFWSNTRGQRDIYTVDADGGQRVAVTNDAAIDWCPVWSTDGRYVYFSSDRGGAMNVWRIAVDQSSGTPAGEAEPVTNGVQAQAAQPKFSADGTRMVFRSSVRSVNPIAIPFDPVTLRAGTPKVLDGSNNIRVPSDVSPDGSRIAYFSIGERQEDLFISPADGTKLQHLTDDAARDRGPMFTRDGQSVVFYSTRGGDWGIWTMRIDGSGARQVASRPGSTIYGLPSPVDDTVVFSMAVGGGLYLVRPEGTGFAAPQLLANTDRTALMATAFSHDGRQLTGVTLSSTGRPGGVYVYDLAAHRVSVVANDETFGVHFLPGDRRLVYFPYGRRQLVVVDTETRQRTPIDLPLPGPAMDDVFAISPDGRTIIYGAVRAEADIWIAERK